mgnify:CR=1 FL=1
MKTDTKYNGWKNRQTWNVALWINNEENYYRAAVDFMRTYDGRAAWAAFCKAYGFQYERTPDGIAYISTHISYRELNAMMRGLNGKRPGHKRTS